MVKRNNTRFLCGERGITFGDPVREYLANPNCSHTRFTRMVFLFLSLSQTKSGKFQKQKSLSWAVGAICFCGERGIRTPGPASRGTHAFQACQLNHSCISP